MLIQLYLEKVAFGMDLFQPLIGDISPLDAWHSGLIKRVGNLTETMQYELHGVGCTFLSNGDFLWILIFMIKENSMDSIYGD